MAVRQCTPRQSGSATIAEDVRIYCANCIHCKLKRDFIKGGPSYQLRVRCQAGRWKLKHGEEKYYKYFTVAKRSIGGCDAYEPMGEVKNFLKDLKRTLPIKDEIYSN